MHLKTHPEQEMPKDQLSGRDVSFPLRDGSGRSERETFLEDNAGPSTGGAGAESLVLVSARKRDGEEKPFPIELQSFVLYAEQKLTLGPRNHVEGGDVGVRSVGRRLVNAQPTGTESRRNDDAQLRVGARSKIQPYHEILAPSVTLGHDVESGRILTDVLVDDGIPLRSENAFPAARMPALPLASVTSTATQPVTVAQGQVRTLNAGQYGALTVDGSLVLNPGTYTFSSISIGFDATVVSADLVTLLVENFLTVGRRAKLHPLFEEPASRLLIFVAGIDPDTTVPTVSFGKHARVRALIDAPHGTVTLADHVHVTGAVGGFTILTGEEVRVVFENGFPDSAPDQSGTQHLSGAYGVPPGPTTAPVVGPVPAATVISLSIGLPVRDPTGLQTLITNVSNPKSSQFRKYISQTDFYSTFGATVADYQAVQAWANGAGFLTIATFPNHLLLRVTGTAAQVQQALFVNLIFRERSDGSLFVATDRNLSLNLSVTLLEINGLGDVTVPTGLNGTGGRGSYRAADLRNAYLGVNSQLQALNGTGQQVGIVDFQSFDQTDVTGYFQNQLPVAGEVSPLPQPNVTLVETESSPPGSPGTPPNSGVEATVDVEMVYAMAPSATISVFQGALGNTDQLDSILHGMATFTPALTVASCSLFFDGTANAQQALDQMATHGVSFFTASGDGGSNNNPASSMQMNHQTLVGGTVLSTNKLNPDGTYPSPYYSSESGWSGSGGGVMSAVGIPEYQVNLMAISAGTSGGSTTNRNYPDVAMLATNAEIFTSGVLTNAFSGTSFAAPLWAGFTALLNQMSVENNAGTMGFLNPLLYDIGLTRGEAGNTDIYDTCLNDIQSGSNGGFTAVAGYDLVTGLGSPKAGLIFQLANQTPTVPVEFHLIRFIVGTGGDDLRRDSSATAAVSLQNGQSFTVTLKNKGDAGWENGSTHGPLDFPFPSTVTTLPTPTQALSGVQINLIQGGSFPETPDNWDITTLQVSLFNPGNQQFCQLNLVGDSELQDGSTGLVRLSETQGSSGNGPSSPVFVPGRNSGC